MTFRTVQTEPEHHPRARPREKRRRLTAYILIAGCLTALAVDDYSFGYIGGDFVKMAPNLEIIPMHPWQIWATAGLALALIVSAVVIRKRAVWLLIFAESSAFALLNFFYIRRDGWEVRSSEGFEGDPTIGWAFLVGCCLRVALVLIVNRMHRTDPPTLTGVPSS